MQMNDNLQIDNGHYTRIHNRILEELAKYQLSGHEIRIIFALWRKTYGFQKKEEWISSDQFQKLTGLGKTRTSEAMRKLKLKNLVTEKRNSNQVIYGFNKHFTTWKQLRKSVTVTEKRNRNYAKAEQKLRKSVTEKRQDVDKKKISETPKETLKETLKESTTVLKEKITFNFDTETWENIKPKNIKSWDKAYPACDIELELIQMKEWLLSNPSKRKSNYRRFITNWLSRSQEKGGSKKANKKPNERKVFNQALESLNIYYTKNKLLAWLSKLPKKYHKEFQKYPDFEEVERKLDLDSKK